jgi:hypothetical protein
MRRIFPDERAPLVVYIDRLFGVAELLRDRAWRRSRARLAVQGWEAGEHSADLARVQAFISRGMAKARALPPS